MESPVLNEFSRFRQMVDTMVDEAWQLYGTQMQCKKGCFSCCRSDFRISPVEQVVLEKAYLQLPKRTREAVQQNLEVQPSLCPLLIEGGCSVYVDRPILCRVFGFPLSDGEAIATCELNFQDRQGETFTAKCFDMNALTAILTTLSEALISEGQAVSTSETIPQIVRAIEAVRHSSK